MLYQKYQKNWIRFDNQARNKYEVVFVWQDSPLDEICSTLLGQLDSDFFKATFLETLFLPSADRETMFLLVGLGTKQTFTLGKFQEAVAKATSTMKQKSIWCFSVNFTGLQSEKIKKMLWFATLGVYLGMYTFSSKNLIIGHVGDKFLDPEMIPSWKNSSFLDEENQGERDVSEMPCASENSPQVIFTGLKNVDQTQPKGKNTLKAYQAIIEEAFWLAKGIFFVRDMTNLPGNLLRPEDLAQRIIEFTQDTGITYELFYFEDLKQMGMNGLLSVGWGSACPPCFLVLHYDGERLNGIGSSKKKGKEADKKSPIKHLGLVGKGVTFDSGGYSLKSSAGMVGMNGDMAGAASVVGTIYSLAKNKVPVKISGFLPLCENRIGPNSISPNDIISTYAGKTVEILNTDAEGRLILADGLSYAVKETKVSHLVDLATLTGAVVGALGHSVTGAVTNNQNLWEQVEAAAAEAQELVWSFPSSPEYEEMIKSDWADVKNVGGPKAGSITAGLFLQEFVEETPWIHLDIAGTGSVEKPVYAYQTKGATGAMVHSLYQLGKLF